MSGKYEKYIENEKVMTAFLHNYRTVDIVRESGLSRSTVDRLRKDPDFQYALRQLRTAMITGAVTRMQQNLLGDVVALENIIQDPDISPQIRVNAIQVALTQIPNLTVTENRMKNLDHEADPNSFDNFVKLF